MRNVLVIGALFLAAFLAKLALERQLPGGSAEQVTQRLKQIAGALGVDVGYYAGVAVRRFYVENWPLIAGGLALVFVAFGLLYQKGAR